MASLYALGSARNERSKALDVNRHQPNVTDEMGFSQALRAAQAETEVSDHNDQADSTNAQWMDCPIDPDERFRTPKQLDVMAPAYLSQMHTASIDADPVGVRHDLMYRQFDNSSSVQSSSQTSNTKAFLEWFDEHAHIQSAQEWRFELSDGDDQPLKLTLSLQSNGSWGAQITTLASDDQMQRLIESLSQRGVGLIRKNP